METSNTKPPKSDFYLSIINTPQRPYLTWLCDGSKTAEGRVFRDSCKQMREGATIVLEDKRNKQWIFGYIKFLHRYDSFKHMLKSEGVKTMLPFLQPDDIDEGIRVYESFPGGHEAIKKGCIAIGIDIQKNNF